MFKRGHDSRAIANIFVGKAQKELDAEQPLTIMSLLKYVYFAHGWTLGHTGNPLIKHKVQAWKYGPVVPEVYETFSPQGDRIRARAVWLPEPDISQEEREIIDSVYEEYSQLSAFRLSAITHAEGAPWHQFRDTHYGEIPNEVIREHYAGLVARLGEDEKD